MIMVMVFAQYNLMDRAIGLALTVYLGRGIMANLMLN
jgi:hypothetical protein